MTRHRRAGTMNGEYGRISDARIRRHLPSSDSSPSAKSDERRGVWREDAPIARRRRARTPTATLQRARCPHPAESVDSARRNESATAVAFSRARPPRRAWLSTGYEQMRNARLTIRFDATSLRPVARGAFARHAMAGRDAATCGSDPCKQSPGRRPARPTPPLRAERANAPMQDQGPAHVHALRFRQGGSGA